MKEDTELFGICPYVTSQKVLTGKWSLLILYHLSSGPVRFNELQRRLPHLTQATLSKQLKGLEANGLVVRKEYQQLPPKVEYSLSSIGQRFQVVLDSLETWGHEYMDYMEEQQK